MESQETNTLDKGEQRVNQYLELFRRDGVPTPKVVTAAFDKAKHNPTIQNWLVAASVANSYGNILDVLLEHHSIEHDSGMENLDKAVEYERARNTYFGYRNYAYLQIAKLYLAQGDKANALSYAMTSVKLSGASPNLDGEALIQQIIEYPEPTGPK